MATAQTVPTDLVLEIEQDLSPERFLAAARAFFGYVQEVARAIAGDDAPEWFVRVKEGSNLIAVDPKPTAPPEFIEAVYNRVVSAARSVEAGEIEGARITDQALKHLKVLAELTERPMQSPILLRLWVKRSPIQITGQIAERIREDWRTDYKDFGTVEGRLESIQDRDGALRLQIRDAFLRQTVPCYFPEAMLKMAFDNFRKRVEVSGVIHYRANGKPISIEVSGIDAISDDSDLPSAKDVRGILRLS